MKNPSPLRSITGMMLTAVIAVGVEIIWSNALIHFEWCNPGDGWCLAQYSSGIIFIILLIGTLATFYNQTIGNENFRTRVVEFIKIPNSENIRLYPKAIEKNKIILKIQNFEWRWFRIPVFVFVKPVENHPDWDGDFSKLDFRNGRNDSFVNLYWLLSKELNFIKINPRENAFYLDSDHNGSIKFPFGKSHRFVVKIYCDYEGKAKVFRTSELVINCKGGHQVELEIKSDSDDNKGKSRKFFYKQRHFQNGGGG